MQNRVGNQNPTHRILAPYENTEGGYASALSSAYDLRPHPWQDTVLNDWLAVNDNGILLNSMCVIEVPRQNGKTGVSDPRETWGLVKRGEQILHTAQEYQTARKAFDRMRKKFGDRRNDPMAIYPELNALVDRYTTSANQMVLDLVNGGHIEFRTRGNGSDMGRGGTFDLVVNDEAQSYTEAQDASLSPLNSAAPSGSPQTIFMGTPPTPDAIHKGYIFAKTIRSMRKQQMKGGCLHMWGVDEVGDVTDKNRWYECNPSLGYQLLESALEKDLLSMSPDTFAREHLGFISSEFMKEADFVIDKTKWDKCKSKQLKPEGKTAYAVKFSLDGSEVVLAGAVIDANGISRISIIERKSTARGSRWLAEWLCQRYSKASCVVVDGKNGADLLIERIADVWKAKDSIIRPKGADIVNATTIITDSINEGSLTWYELQQDLNDSALTSVKRSVSGGYGFGGSNPLPIETCALALFGAKTSKRDPNREMRIG